MLDHTSPHARHSPALVDLRQLVASAGLWIALLSGCSGRVDTASGAVTGSGTIAPESLAVRVRVVGAWEVVEPNQGALSTDPDHAKPRTLRGGYQSVRLMSLLRSVPAQRGRPTLTLYFDTTGRDTLLVPASDSWFPVLMPAHPTPAALRAMIEQGKLFVLGGRTRNSFPDGVTWPSPGAKLSPAFGSIRWNAPPTARRVTLGLGQIAGDVNWSRIVTAESGSYSGDDLRAQLRDIQTSGRIGTYLMAGVSGGGTWEPLEVHVMSISEEQALLRELAALTETDRVQQSVARGNLFWSRGLFANAGDEFEAAIAAESTNVALIKRAAAARRAYGDRARFHALIGLLAPQDSLP